MILFITAACQQATQIPASSSLSAKVSPTKTRNQNISSPTAIPSPSPGKTQTAILKTSPLPLGTPTPTRRIFRTPTYTPKPSITPTPTITARPGYQFWNAGSRWGPGAYAIQYQENKWREENGRLYHQTIPGCEVGEHGGSDVCGVANCVESGKIIGEAQFLVTDIGNIIAYEYIAPGVRFGIQRFEAVLADPADQCLEDAEEVLGTLKFRPERNCSDRAEFVADITIPDNTVIAAGTKFTKTWRLKNVGTCTWTKEYSLGVFGPTEGGNFRSVPFDQEVLPQRTVDLSVELTAPEIIGEARWDAMIEDDLGLWFGTGRIGYQPFWVQITVVSTPEP